MSWSEPKTDYISSDSPDPAELNIVGNNQIDLGLIYRTIHICTRGYSMEFTAGGPGAQDTAFEDIIDIPNGYEAKLKRVFTAIDSTVGTDYDWTITFNDGVDTDVYLPAQSGSLEYSAADLDALDYPSLQNTSGSTKTTSILIEVTNFTGVEHGLNNTNIEITFQLVPTT